MSLLALDFDGLYTRHLGRHSQAGINIAHLIALYGLWFGIYAADRPGYPPAAPSGFLAIVVVMAAGYLATIGINAPPAVTAATAAFMALFVDQRPVAPGPASLVDRGLPRVDPRLLQGAILEPRVWTKAADMSEFNKRFPPGRDLNIILLFYEVPICLNYLLFRPKDWIR